MMSIDEINKLQEENRQLRELYRIAKSLYKEQKQENAELKAENERLKADVNSLQYNIAEFSNNVIDTAVTLFAKDKAKLEAENSLLKAYKNTYYQQTLDDEIQINELYQTLQEIKEIAEELSCKHPEECFENKPDWNGEVYGCDVADNWKNPSELATCPSKLASAILQIITKAESEVNE